MSDPTPIALWTDTLEQTRAYTSLITLARVDDRYQVEVQRTETGARLVIFDHDNDNLLLLNEPTTLAYDAILGPDVEDINRWQMRVDEFLQA